MSLMEGTKVLSPTVYVHVYNKEMTGPLTDLAQWDDFVEDRYRPDRKPEEFRNYTPSAPPVVQEFYRQNHANQTREFVLQKKREYGALARRRMGIWQAMEYLNTL